MTSTQGTWDADDVGAAEGVGADAARVGILLASLLAGLVGAALLRRVPVRG